MSITKSTEEPKKKVRGAVIFDPYTPAPYIVEILAKHKVPIYGVEDVFEAVEEILAKTCVQNPHESSNYLTPVYFDGD